MNIEIDKDVAVAGKCEPFDMKTSRVSPNSGSSAAPNQLVHQLSVELVENIAALNNYKKDWARLSANALEHNILFDPAVAMAALSSLEVEKRVKFVFVWLEFNAQTGGKRKLIGLFPLTDHGFRWGLPVSCAKAWDHAHSFLSTPLLDSVDARMAAEGFFHWMKQECSCSRFLLYQLIGRGKVWEIFNQVFAQNNFRVDEYDQHERAMLQSDLDGEDYLRQALGRKRTKEYRRLRNRLGDLGTVEFKVTDRPEGVTVAINKFLELEARGWKGKRNSALNSSVGGRQFILESLHELALTGNCNIGELMLDDKTVASVIVVNTGRSAWMWKIAYDEEYSRYSPGVLLVLELTKQLLNDKTYDYVDSCALPDHPMINHIWRERFPVTDILITTRPGIVPSSVVASLETLRRSARSNLKSVYNRFIRR